MPKLFRLLLFAYPPSLRRSHGSEMSAAFDDAWRVARSRGVSARVSLIGRLFIDFIRCWPAAWRRSRGGFKNMSLIPQIRFALRLLKKYPASTAATLLTLALAIGLNTAVFSVVHAVLLAPLPYADADRLVRLHEH